MSTLLIPTSRTNELIAGIIARLEKDKLMAKKIKEIRARTKSKVIEVSDDARIEFNRIAMKKIEETITKSINVLYLTGKATITKEVIEQSKEI